MDFVAGRRSAPAERPGTARGALRARERGREEGPAAVLRQPAAWRSTSSSSTRIARSSATCACAGRSTTRIDRRALARLGALPAGLNARPTSTCRPGCRASATPASTRSRPISPRRGGSQAGSGAPPSSTPATHPRATRMAQIIKANLAAIGIDVAGQDLPVRGDVQHGSARKGEPFDIALGRLDCGLPRSRPTSSTLLLSERRCIPHVRRSGLQAQARRRGAALGAAPLPRLQQARRRSRPQRCSVGCVSAARRARTSSPRGWAARSSSRSYGFMDLAALCLRARR